MSSQGKDSAPSAVTEVSKAELEDSQVSGRFQPSESTVHYNRANGGTLSDPQDYDADEEMVKSPFALPDELVAKVLGYLTLRERFKLETVCRQWQRCMYMEVEHLYLDFYHEQDQKYTLRISKVGEITSSWTEELPAVLHKLRRSKVGFLSCIIEDNISDTELFTLLADIASQATKVVVAYDVTFSSANLVTFCDIIGPHVTTFQLTLVEWQELPEGIQAIASSLARMKRLKEVSSNWPNLIFTCLNSFPINTLPNIQEIKPRFSEECDWMLWEHFKSLYGAQIKKITFPDGCLLDDLDEVLLPWKDMAPFASLEYLDIEFYVGDCTLTALAEDLEGVSRSCPLLKSFGLKHAVSFKKIVLVSLMEVQKLFRAFGKMKMLENLDLDLVFHLVRLGEVSSGEDLDLFALLENKFNITRLKAVVRLYQISSQKKVIHHEVFGSLSNAMPNLRHLDVFCKVSELDHFVGLERLQTVHLSYFCSKEASKAIEDSLICILKCSPSLRRITFLHLRIEVSEALIGAIMEATKLQMEKHIDFVAEITVDNKSQKAWEAMKHFAPRNLKLSFEDEWNSDSE